MLGGQRGLSHGGYLTGDAIRVHADLVRSHYCGVRWREDVLPPQRGGSSPSFLPERNDAGTVGDRCTYLYMIHL